MRKDIGRRSGPEAPPAEQSGRSEGAPGGGATMALQTRGPPAPLKSPWPWLGRPRAWLGRPRAGPGLPAVAHLQPRSLPAASLVWVMI